MSGGSWMRILSQYAVRNGCRWRRARAIMPPEEVLKMEMCCVEEWDWGRFEVFFERG